MQLSPENVPLWGDTLCLDFANSVSWSDEDELFDPDHMDVLRSPEMLNRWAHRLGLLRGGAAASEAELRRVRQLRDAVHRLFASIGNEREPTASDVALLMRN